MFSRELCGGVLLSIGTVVDEDVEGLRRSENTYTVLLCSSRSTVAVAVGWPPWNRNMNTNKRDMPWMVDVEGRYEELAVSLGTIIIQCGSVNHYKLAAMPFRIKIAG